MSERHGKPMLLAFMQAALDDVPLGLILLDHLGRLLWHNQEAAIVSTVWNEGAKGADALPMDRAVDMRTPPALWAECRAMLAGWSRRQVAPAPRFVDEPSRGLHAEVRFLAPTPFGPDPAFCLRLDYRRPRTDRNRPLSDEAVALLARLSFREREVALRIRDGLATGEIARELRRSPLTIKTQLASVYGKLAVRGRSRVAVLLNR